MNLSLYQINKEIEEVMQGIVGEGGEISPSAEMELDALQQDRLVKIKNIGLYYKEAQAFVDRCKAEEARIRARRQSIEKRLSWLRTVYLPNNLDGEKIDEPELKISTRSSKSIEIGPFADLKQIRAISPELVSIEYKPHKKEIREYIERTGMEFEDVRIVEKQSVSIK